MLHNSFFLLLFFRRVIYCRKRNFMYLYFCEKKRFPLPLRKDFNSSTCRLQIFYLNFLSSSYRPEALSCLPSQWGGHEDGQETETISTFKKKKKSVISTKGFSQSPRHTAKNVILSKTKQNIANTETEMYQLRQESHSASGVANWSQCIFS